MHRAVNLYRPADRRRDRLPAVCARAGEPVLPGGGQALRAGRDDPDLEPVVRGVGPGVCGATRC